MGVNWRCEYCGRDQTVVNERSFVCQNVVPMPDLAIGVVAIRNICIGCANPECRKLTLTTQIVSAFTDSLNRYYINPSPSIKSSFKILPIPGGKQQPEYIPVAIREDYDEACRIRDLSPKASATLSRRCLQGMIRDFCGISARTLDGEIRALAAAVQAGTAPRYVQEESLESIDAVRKIGNIGAHMEKDPDLIIPVEPEEAQLLIELIESLFQDWYVARAKSLERAQRIRAAVETKAAMKVAEPAALPAPQDK